LPLNLRTSKVPWFNFITRQLNPPPQAACAGTWEARWGVT